MLLYRIWKRQTIFYPDLSGMRRMINGFAVNDYKSVVRIMKFFDRDCRILFVVFFTSSASCVEMVLVRMVIFTFLPDLESNVRTASST